MCKLTCLLPDCKGQRQAGRKIAEHLHGVLSLPLVLDPESHQPQSAPPLVEVFCKKSLGSASEGPACRLSDNASIADPLDVENPQYRQLLFTPVVTCVHSMMTWYPMYLCVHCP